MENTNDDRSVRLTLEFDVMGVYNELFKQQAVIVEKLETLGFGNAPRFRKVLVIPADTHPLSATTSSSLEEDRVATKILIANVQCLIK